MGMASICENCLNRFRCIIDSLANVQRCAMYQPEPDYSKLFDQIAEKMADKIIERLALKNSKEHYKMAIDDMHCIKNDA